MTDPNTKDPILRSLLLLILELLDEADSIAQSTQPMAKRDFRSRAKYAAIMLREELPADAFDVDAHAITLAANDPARGEP